MVGCGVAWEDGLGCRDGGDPHTIIKYWDAGLGRWGCWRGVVKGSEGYWGVLL